MYIIYNIDCTTVCTVVVVVCDGSASWLKTGHRCGWFLSFGLPPKYSSKRASAQLLQAELLRVVCILCSVHSVTVYDSYRAILNNCCYSLSLVIFRFPRAATASSMPREDIQYSSKYEDDDYIYRCVLRINCRASFANTAPVLCGIISILFIVFFSFRDWPQTRNTTRRHGQTGSKDSSDDGIGVAKSRRSNDVRLGSLHEIQPRCVLFINFIFDFERADLTTRYLFLSCFRML